MIHIAESKLLTDARSPTAAARTIGPDADPISSRPRSGKVLVLGEGVAAFLAVIRSLGRRGIEVHVAWCPADSPALRSRYVRKVHRLPAYAPGGAWKSELLALQLREQFDLILSTNEQCLRPLQRHHAELSPAARLYVLNDRAFDVVFDKWRSLSLAKSLGICVPRSRMISDVDELARLPMDFGWPVVLKPLSSYSPDDLLQRREVVKAYTEPELLRGGRRLLEQGPIVAQECFVGRGVGVEMLADEGQVLVALQHERIHQPARGGASSYRRTVPLRGDLVDAAARLVEALRYTGVIMVEYLVDPKSGEWRFVEMNGRFWGSLPLALAAGADFPYYLYQLLIDGTREFPQQYREQLYCRNLIGDIAWTISNFRANRGDPTLATASLAQVVRDWGNLFLLRERSDTFVVDDPRPGFAEVAYYLRRWLGAIRGRGRVALLQLPWVRQRASSRAVRAVCRARSVLFVCFGNICRSPFAAEYARRDWPADLAISSSGLHPKSNRPAPEFAIAVAKELGIDLTAHRSTVVSDETISDADVILSCDESVHRELLRRYPAAKRKVYRAGLLARAGPVNIPDPFGESIDHFRAAYERIAELLGNRRSSAAAERV